MAVSLYIVMTCGCVLRMWLVARAASAERWKGGNDLFAGSMEQPAALLLEPFPPLALAAIAALVCGVSTLLAIPCACCFCSAVTLTAPCWIFPLLIASPLLVPLLLLSLLAAGCAGFALLALTPLALFVFWDHVPPETRRALSDVRARAQAAVSKGCLRVGMYASGVGPAADVACAIADRLPELASVQVRNMCYFCRPAQWGVGGGVGHISAGRGGHISACRGSRAVTCAGVTDPPAHVRTGQPVNKKMCHLPAGWARRGAGLARAAAARPRHADRRAGRRRRRGLRRRRTDATTTTRCRGGGPRRRRRTERR